MRGRAANHGVSTSYSAHAETQHLRVQADHRRRNVRIGSETWNRTKNSALTGPRLTVKLSRNVGGPTRIRTEIHLLAKQPL